MSIPYEHLLQEILIDEKTLQNRIAELGAQISRDYAGMKHLLFVCVLKGGVMFLTDLTRHIDVPHAIDFMAVSSYGKHARETTGVVRIDMDLRQDIQGRHLVLVEDIVDSGHTLAYLRGLLMARKPASIKICTLLSKPSRRQVDVPIDYLGFDIPDKFVFGYGLDLDELYRNLPFVAVARAGVSGESE
ncbi:MAG TPA: hypoxanthine phosphoribosyltransferase [Aggregatilineales bacterium]|nr:hypoxanthine phosphoribosyltransferase [Aggregatilineales bacterium]